jgi:sugar transferase (PEP-CTERM system associated)
MRPLRVMASRTGAMLLALDTVLVAAIWPALLWIVGGAPVAALLLEPGLAVYPVAQIVLLYALGLYRREAILSTRSALARLPLVVALAIAGGACMHWVGDWAVAPQAVVDVFRLWAAASVGFAVCGAAARILLHAMLQRGVLRRRVMVVGAGRRAREMLAMVARNGEDPHFDVLFVHEPSHGTRDPDLGRGAGQTVVVASESNYLNLAIAHDVDQIVVAPDERRGMRLEKLLDCKKNGFPVVQHLAFVEREAKRVDLAWIELGWFLYSDGYRFGPIDRALKRLLDVAVSLVVLGFGAFLLVPAAVAVKLQDGGPVFYAQTRVTRGGRLFRILKLRTMRVDAERAGAQWAAAGDNRVTRVGRFLRHTRIDEIPQLINVLRGDMSLVGPRPERPEFIGQLADKIPLFEERLTVNAGLTGWAQINYPYGASIEDARAKLGYDLYYVKNFSILFDMLILLQTLRVVLFPGAAGAR